MGWIAKAARWRMLAGCLLASAMCVGASTVGTEARPADSAAKLRLVYEALPKPLGEARLRSPPRLESTETSSQVSGDAFGVVDHSFAGLSAALADPSHWCDILILHVNNKACRFKANGSTATLSMKVARKYDQAVDQAYPIEFSFQAPEATPQYLSVHLSAANGPLGTNDYRIAIEAIPIGDGTTFVHLSYSYRFGFTTRMAMGVYFATVGSGKVGFTQVGRLPNGQPQYIDGMRGLMERNTMRYFLAIEAYLAMLGKPGAGQFEARLRRWFDATERYPRQLHEVDMPTYLQIKLQENGASPLPTN